MASLFSTSWQFSSSFRPAKHKRRSPLSFMLSRKNAHKPPDWVWDLVRRYMQTSLKQSLRSPLWKLGCWGFIMFIFLVFHRESKTSSKVPTSHCLPWGFSACPWTIGICWQHRWPKFQGCQVSFQHSPDWETGFGFYLGRHWPTRSRSRHPKLHQPVLTHQLVCLLKTPRVSTRKTNERCVMFHDVPCIYWLLTISRHQLPSCQTFFQPSSVHSLWRVLAPCSPQPAKAWLFRSMGLGVWSSIP